MNERTEQDGVKVLAVLIDWLKKQPQSHADACGFSYALELIEKAKAELALSQASNSVAVQPALFTEPDRKGIQYATDETVRAVHNEMFPSVAVQEPVAWLMKRGTEGKILFHKDEVNEYFDNGWRIEIELFNHAHPITSQEGMKLVPIEPTTEMREEGAQRLVSWEDNSSWPESWTPLQISAARNEAERVWRSMWLVAAPTLDKEENE